MALAVFDLDHTLIDGDSDTLWCDFLIGEGVLDGPVFSARNSELERGYRAGSVSVAAFCAFYIGTLAGRTAQEWAALRQRFWQQQVQPRICPGTAALLQQHRERGDLLVLSTATNRFLTELTAAGLGFEHLIATECEQDEQGRFTGRPRGTPNMRAGKVERLTAWLARQGEPQTLADAHFYSDSINDLPLLQAVGHPVVVDPDERLRQHAQRRSWPVLSLR